jgi:hypothetical protein
VPGGIVADNTLIWRQFHFSPVTTSRIRVFMTEGLRSHSRLTEVEAYAVLGTENQSPSVILTSPPSGGVFAASTPVTLEATATDVDGSVSRVDFYANGTLVETDTTGSAGQYTATWVGTVAGAHSLTAVATDDGGATRTSNPVVVTVMPPPGRTNVALPANGGVALASSTLDSGYPAGSVINGDRQGLAWGSGGGWADGTANTWPDWVEVQFNGSQAIEEIDVFMVQDSYGSPSEPTPDMTFTMYGVSDFVVEYWTGSDWQPVPGGVVADNSLVWRQFHFSPVTTPRIRVFMTEALAGRSRLVEIEAYAALGSENLPPSVALTSPPAGAVFAVSTPVALEATASDSDGAVSQVDFYADGLLVATDTTAAAGVYSVTWTSSALGSHTLAAVATDDRGATQTTSPVTVTLTPPPGRMNVALAANGGVALASSTFEPGYPANSVVNGDRRGLGWGSGGGWADGTANTWPDWVEVQFNGPQLIEEIDVFMVQDNYASPSEPTPDMTFTKYGVLDFRVEYWTGSNWQPLPGGIVVDNNLVWRDFHFVPVTTSRIRVFMTEALASRSRLVEIEAYAVLGSENLSPSVALTSPATGAVFGVSSPISLEATAADTDGTVSQVQFYANGTLVGTDPTGIGGVYSATWTGTVAGSYSLTAVAIDDGGAARTSTPVTITLAAPPGRMNVALAANGGVALASSSYGSGYPASSVINGDRKGQGWGSGGGWADGTPNAWPDWVEVQFTGPRAIEEIDVFMVQDSYATPSEPTPGMTFTKYGVRDFTVEYWTGSAWQPLPGGSVADNTLVWRQFQFAPVTTSRIRVRMTEGLASHSRLTEVEVYATIGG